MNTLPVFLVHDFVCPCWCLTGEARLIAGLPKPGALRIRYRPFELNGGALSDALVRGSERGCYIENPSALAMTSPVRRGTSEEVAR
jgi:hypothetical protein